MNKTNEIFNASGVTFLKKLYFYLTCWRPVTKLEFARLQAQLILILEGMRSSDLQHYQIEKLLEKEILKLKESKYSKDKNGNENKDQMFG